MKSKFFVHVCQILGINNIFTTTYHPQTNGKAERFNRTICSSLRKYIGDHPIDWDLYTLALTFSYNRVLHTSTGTLLFDLVLSRPILKLLTEADNPNRVLRQKIARLLKEKRLETLVLSAKEAFQKAQYLYEAAYSLRFQI